MAGRPPVDLSKVSAETLYPEGRFRARIVSMDEYPKDTEKGENGELVGQFTDDGRQKYAWVRTGFRFMEHPNNVAPDPKTGEPTNLAGRQIWRSYFYYPDQMNRIRQLYDAAGVDPTQDYEPLLNNEVDITIKNKPRRDEPDVTESNVSSVRAATG